MLTNYLIDIIERNDENRFVDHICRTFRTVDICIRMTVGYKKGLGRFKIFSGLYYFLMLGD
jgi:hypothetical protein